jgi:protein TonB
VAAAKNQTSATPDEIVNQPPVYPEDALQDREQGEVILLVEVTASGTAREVRIAQSSGYFLLDQAALRAVGKWRFHPARAAGVAVSSETRVKVNFKAQE